MSIERTPEDRARFKADLKRIAAKLRCSGCLQPVGQQHKPSCPRQGIVTADSDYRDRKEVY
jgi:hypothetical protein